jgi:hypothetical protein
MDMKNSLVINTGSHGQQAAQSFSAQAKLPCAIVGPFNDMPAEELSVLATSFEIPLTVARAFNLRVISEDFSPYSSQIYPDLSASALNLVDYLDLRNHTDFIATVYGGTGYFSAQPNFFQTYSPQYSDEFMFDAVMATAMGACLTDRNGTNTTGPTWQKS